MRYIVRLVFFAYIFSFVSCFDDLSALTANFKVRLCDAPDPNIRSFIVDIQAIQVKVISDSDMSGWITLDNVKTGQIDLMMLSNGTDSLLASQDLPVGKLSQIKLILGENNKVVFNDGTERVMYLLASQLNTLKLNINTELYADVDYELFVDFDVARSLSVDNTGVCFLNPSIRTFNQTSTGEVAGQINPHTFETYVGVVSGTDTIAGTISKEGKFYIKGISPGNNYRLILLPSTDSNYMSKDIESVSIVAHRQTFYDVELNKR